MGAEHGPMVFLRTSAFVARFTAAARPTPACRFLASLADGEAPDDVRLLLRTWSAHALATPLRWGRFAMRAGQPARLDDVPYSWKHPDYDCDDVDANGWSPGLTLGTVSLEGEGWPVYVAPSRGLAGVSLWPRPGESSVPYAPSFEAMLEAALGPPSR
jgi:hypothetical protein